MVDKWIGKVAVVTGSSGGIGTAIIKDFIGAGINVVGLDLKTEDTENLAKQFEGAKGKVFAYKCDVADNRSIKKAFEWIESKFGSVNILVNNAGIAHNINLLDPSDEATEKMNDVININLRGLTHCTREAFRLMKKSGDYGYIINLNSVIGHYVPLIPAPMNLYPATKHGVTAITETIRQELVFANNKKVRVTSLSPGRVDTNLYASAGYKSPSEGKYLVLKPADISQAVMFLLSTPYTVNVTELTIRPTGEFM